MPHLAHVLLVDETEIRQAFESVVEVGCLLPGELELVGGLVVREHRAVAVEDQAAAGRNWLGTYPVTLGQLRVVVMTQDLEQIQASRQSECEHEDQHAGDHGTLVEEPLLFPVVLDAYAAGSHVSNPQELRP